MVETEVLRGLWSKIPSTRKKKSTIFSRERLPPLCYLSRADTMFFSWPQRCLLDYPLRLVFLTCFSHLDVELKLMSRGIVLVQWSWMTHL